MFNSDYSSPCPAAEVPEVVKLNRPVWFDGWFRFGMGGLPGDLIGLELEEWLWMLLWLLGTFAIWSLLWICELWWSRRATLPCLPCVLSTGSINGDRDSKAGDLIGVEWFVNDWLQRIPETIEISRLLILLANLTFGLDNALLDFFTYLMALDLFLVEAGVAEMVAVLILLP